MTKNLQDFYKAFFALTGRPYHEVYSRIRGTEFELRCRCGEVLACGHIDEPNRISETLTIVKKMSHLRHSNQCELGEIVCCVDPADLANLIRKAQR